VTDDAALYVHIPFCETKCPYCDFNSFSIEGRDVDGYLDALAREMDARGVPRRPSTLFIGGGTPTVVTPDQLDRYLTDILSRVEADSAREFTVEANPGSLTAEKVAVLRAHGVNRISIGAQSFLPHHLATLGRVHSPAQIDEAYAFARDGGIADVNLDFIHALPKQTLREWVETLERATAMRPDHLSCYALIFEPGTEFHARRVAGRMHVAPEPLELAMFRWTERRLRRAGLPRYEISNFARPGHECRHNLTYWRNQSYAGYGAGAHSFLGGDRLANERHLGRYTAAVRENGDAFVNREHLDGIAGAREMVALGLRVAEGVDLAEVGARFGIDAESEFGPMARQLEQAGYVRHDKRLRLARRGWRVADAVASEFL